MSAPAPAAVAIPQNATLIQVENLKVANPSAVQAKRDATPTAFQRSISRTGQRVSQGDDVRLEQSVDASQHSSAKNAGRVSAQLERVAGQDAPLPVYVPTGWNDTKARNLELVKACLETVEAQNWLGGRQQGRPEYDRSRNLKESNLSSYHFSVLSTNLGNLERNMYMEGKYLVPADIKNDLLPMVRFIASAGAHLWCTCEAQYLDGPVAQSILESRGIKGVVCHSPKEISAPALGCHTKGPDSTTVTLLDSHFDLHSNGKHWGIASAFFEVTWGDDHLTGTQAIRSGLTKLTVCVFHLNNDTAKKVEAAKSCMVAVIKRCMRYQVDLIFGDGNTAVNRFCPSQQYPDRVSALIPTIIREAFSSLNIDKELWERPSIYPIETESAIALATAGSVVQDMDCMTGYAVSWGKTLCNRIRRQELADLVLSLRQQDFEGMQLTQAQYDLLEKTAPSEIGLLEQLEELHITVSEHGKHITSRDLFLRDGDKDSHKPMYATIREHEFRHERKSKKNATNPFRKLLRETGMEKLAKTVVTSELMSLVKGAKAAEQSCPFAASAVETHQDDGDAFAFFQFMLMFFLLGMLFGFILSCWCRYKCSRQRTLQTPEAVPENNQEPRPKAKAAPKNMAAPPVFDGNNANPA